MAPVTGLVDRLCSVSTTLRGDCGTIGHLDPGSPKYTVVDTDYISHGEKMIVHPYTANFKIPSITRFQTVSSMRFMPSSSDRISP